MKLSVRETTVFGFLGALMFISKLVTDALPNIHLIAVFTVAFTVVYRVKALFPIYIFVFLCGLYGGFSLWWIPYLYIWLILWGAVMLLPKNVSPVILIGICSLYGFLYGIMYAPAQALMFGYSFDQTVKWIIAGLCFDLIHGVSNLVSGFLIVPIAAVLKKLERKK